jgi:hypothetical protein
LAYSLRFFNHYKNVNIWVSIKDFLIASLYDSEYDEILNLIVGFDDLLPKLKE